MRTLKTQVTKLLTYAFALVGFFDLIGRGIILIISGMIYGYFVKIPFDYDVHKVLPSPNNALKAIVYVWSGPAFDAGCDKIVAVADRWQSTTTAWRDTNIVYRANCDMLGQIRWEPPADGRVRPRLRIDADPGKADFMSRSAVGGKVAIAFPNDP